VTEPPHIKLGPALVGGSIQALSAKTSARGEAGSKKRHSHKPLPKEFRRGGFTYKQIARERNAAIYEQAWTGCAEPSVCYEVIRIKRRDGFEIHGRFVGPAELYPRSESWGTDGCTVPDKESAFRKLRKLLASSNVPVRFGQKRRRNLLEKSPT
jgi:hypothetical protein